MTGPDPDVTIYYASKAIPAKGGAGQNTMQYANPEVDELLAEGATTLDQRQARGDLQADGRRSSGMICRCCRSSSTRGSKARRQS